MRTLARITPANTMILWICPSKLEDSIPPNSIGTLRIPGQTPVHLSSGFHRSVAPADPSQL